MKYAKITDMSIAQYFANQRNDFSEKSLILELISNVSQGGNSV